MQKQCHKHTKTIFMKKEKNYQKEIQDILSNEFSTKNITIFTIIGIVLLPILFLLGSKFGSSSLFIIGIISIIDILVIAYLFSLKKKHSIAKQRLDDAFDYSRIDNVKATIENLVQAYQNVKNYRLLEFIFIYATQYRPDFKLQSEITSLELNKLKAQKTKDKQLIEILKHILNTTSDIERHKNFISKSNLKIKHLKEEINQTEEQELLDEFNIIIKRYEGIVLKGQEKIKKDEQKVKNLLKLKNNFIISKRIKQAREELIQMEDEFWTNSISDEYTTDYNEDKIKTAIQKNKKEESTQQILRNHKSHIERINSEIETEQAV